jgi:hypothetical protein
MNDKIIISDDPNPFKLSKKEYEEELKKRPTSEPTENDIVVLEKLGITAQEMWEMGDDEFEQLWNNRMEKSNVSCRMRSGQENKTGDGSTGLTERGLPRRGASGTGSALRGRPPFDTSRIWSTTDGS